MRNEQIRQAPFLLQFLQKIDDLLSIGFYDYLDRPGICLVEWSENIPYALPDDYVRVALCKDDADKPDSRTLTIEQIGGAGA